MKKTFNLYCILLVVAMFTSWVFNFDVICGDFIRGFNEGYAGANTSWNKQNDGTPYNPDYAYSISLYPTDYKQTSDSLFNSLSGQHVPINIYRAEAYAPDFTTTSGARWCHFFELLFAAVAFLLMFPSFILIIRTINQGNIFSDRISLLLTLLGISLIAFFFCDLFHDYSNYLNCVNNFAAEGYNIRKPSPDEMHLLYGIGLLAIAQVVKMGKRMKEEQDLTI